jgi:hypothetical protein
VLVDGMLCGRYVVFVSGVRFQGYCLCFLGRGCVSPYGMGFPAGLRVVFGGWFTI